MFPFFSGFLPGPPQAQVQFTVEALVTALVPRGRYCWLRTRGLRLIFFFAYAMMMLTILEQGRIIHAQQMLIRQLYPDSVELTSAKARQSQAHR